MLKQGNICAVQGLLSAPSGSLTSKAVCRIINALANLSMVPDQRNRPFARSTVP
jgi:hypothetical protein